MLNTPWPRNHGFLLGMSTLHGDHAIGVFNIEVMGLFQIVSVLTPSWWAKTSTTNQLLYFRVHSDHSTACEWDKIPTYNMAMGQN